MSGKPTACELVSLHPPEWLITISNLSLVTDPEIGESLQARSLKKGDVISMA